MKNHNVQEKTDNKKYGKEENFEEGPE